MGALQTRKFFVNKTRIPFSATGADHGIEHENRAMKVVGGIKGITNSKEAIYRFALPGDFVTKVKQINSPSDLISMRSFVGPSYFTIKSSANIILI